MDKRLIFRYHQLSAKRHLAPKRLHLRAQGRVGQGVSEGGTQGDSVSVLWLQTSKLVGWEAGKSTSRTAEKRMRGRRRLGPSHVSPDWQEKPRSEDSWCPYRKPTQVGGGERPKVIGRTSVKELGKIVP